MNNKGTRRFVILFHEMPAQSPRRSHWDLMLEKEDGLATWAMDELILERPSVTASRLAEHRKEYLTFEGDVSGGRGTVTQVATGTYETISQSPERLTVRLMSSRDAMTIELVEQATDRFLISVVELSGDGGATKD